MSLWSLLRPPVHPALHQGRPRHRALVAYSPGYRVSFFGFERLHPFDIAKYDRIAAHLQQAGLLSASDFAVAPEAGRDQLELVHSPAYLATLHEPATLSAALEVPVPGLTPAGVINRRILAPMRRAVGGTVAAARGALAHGLGVNLGGGFHHARPALGHGFCLFADVAIAVAQLRAEGFTAPVLIVDTDAHQGDGNHAVFADDPSVTTFSMHQADGFPDPRIPGDRDVCLTRGTGDEAYLSRLEDELLDLLGRVEAPQQPAPGLLIHVAGVDVLSDDPLTQLNLNPAGVIARDGLVLRMAEERGIPLLMVLAGGYGPSAARTQARSVAAMLRAR